MKKLLFMIMAVLAISVNAQTPDTLRVIQSSDGVGTWYARTNSNGSFRLGPNNPFTLVQPSIVLDTVGADTIDFYSGITRVKRYAVAKFYLTDALCSTCSTTQDYVNYINWYKLNKAATKIQTTNMTSVERDSFYNWGPPAVGTRIFNTTIDSPQIRVSGTIKWRNH